MKNGRDAPHRAPNKQLCVSEHLCLAGFHQSPVTCHSYFLGLDSGGTNPDTR
jgi:hypothetical protein